MNHVDMYHHWDPGVVHEGHNYEFNAWNGREWSHNWGTHFNPYSSRVDARPNVVRFGAYNGNFHAQLPIIPATPRVSEQRDIYSSSDGNVYRYNPSGTWERNTGQTWQRAPEAPRANLEQQAVGHNMGDQRFNNYRSFGGGFSRPAGGSGFGGGGHR